MEQSSYGSNCITAPPTPAVRHEVLPALPLPAVVVLRCQKPPSCCCLRGITMSCSVNLQPPNCLWISASCCLLVSLYFASTLALCPSPLWCSERVLCFCVLAPDGLESSLMAPSYPKPGEFCGWFSSVLWTHSSPASIPSAVCQKWTDSAALPNPVWHLKMEGTARFFVPVPSWHWQGTFSALEKDKCADLFCPLDLNRGCYVTLSLWGLPEHTPYITPQQVAIE